MAVAGPFASPDVFLRRAASTKLCWKTSKNEPILVLVDSGCFWALTRDLCSGFGSFGLCLVRVGGRCSRRLVFTTKNQSGLLATALRGAMWVEPPPPKPPSAEARRVYRGPQAAGMLVTGCC